MASFPLIEMLLNELPQGGGGEKQIEAQILMQKKSNERGQFKQKHLQNKDLKVKISIYS